MKFIDKYKKILLIIIVIVGCVIYSVFIDNDKINISNNIENTNIKIDNKIEDPIEEAKQESNTKNKIYIYLTGEVVNGGVLVLDEGSRIVDAIDAAGGLTENADITKINLVYVLEDGMKINIPNKTEENQEEPETQIQNSYEKENKGNKVNINTAKQTELETLPGIGPSLALKIINYRKENGNFKNKEDIKNVNGIGDSKYENIKEFIEI